MQNFILYVIEWLHKNKLSLNKSKSKYMNFHVPNKDIQYLGYKPKLENTF